MRLRRLAVLRDGWALVPTAILASAVAGAACSRSPGMPSGEGSGAGAGTAGNSSAHTSTDADGGADDGTDEPAAGGDGSVAAAGARAIEVAVVLNPYAAVDWATWGQYKANFHAHTTNSDGADPPEVVIEQYHSKSYDVLAITDHDATTWPWTDYGMEPESLGMLAVRGNEYSQSHHVNAFYGSWRGRCQGHTYASPTRARHRAVGFQSRVDVFGCVDSLHA